MMDRIANKEKIVDQEEILNQEEIPDAKEIQALIFSGLYDSKKKKEFAELARRSISSAINWDTDEIFPSKNIINLTIIDMIREKIGNEGFSLLIEKYVNENPDKSVAQAL